MVSSVVNGDHERDYIEPDIRRVISPSSFSSEEQTRPELRFIYDKATQTHYDPDADSMDRLRRKVTKSDAKSQYYTG